MPEDQPAVIPIIVIPKFMFVSRIDAIKSFVTCQIANLGKVSWKSLNGLKLGCPGETVVESLIIGIALVRAHQKIDRLFFRSILTNDIMPRTSPPIKA